MRSPAAATVGMLQAADNPRISSGKPWLRGWGSAVAQLRATHLAVRCEQVTRLLTRFWPGNSTLPGACLPGNPHICLKISRSSENDHPNATGRRFYLICN
jgi:hypothetical protein